MFDTILNIILMDGVRICGRIINIFPQNFGKFLVLFFFI